MLRIPFRTDAYGRSFYIVENRKEAHIPFRTGEFSEHGISFSVVEEETNDILHLSIGVCVEKAIPVERFGFRLGIDTYMDSYPQWNHKLFPTALRCEKMDFGPALCRRKTRCSRFAPLPKSSRGKTNIMRPETMSGTGFIQAPLTLSTYRNNPKDIRQTHYRKSPRIQYITTFIITLSRATMNCTDLLSNMRISIFRP